MLCVYWFRCASVRFKFLSGFERRRVPFRGGVLIYAGRFSVRSAAPNIGDGEKKKNTNFGCFLPVLGPHFFLCVWRLGALLVMRAESVFPASLLDFW